MTKRNSLAHFRSIFFLLLAVITAAFVLRDNPIQRILKHLKYAADNFPQEKLYLHLDKPMYAVGEDIWFKAYLVDASFHRPDSISRVIYVELFDPNKTLLYKHLIPLQKDSTYGDFHLEDTLKAGNYVIRAYTNYMKNQGEEFFFQKQISVIGNKKQEAKLLEDKPIDLQFFPEGGSLLSGVMNRVAFKAIDQFGKGTSVEAVIVDEKDSLIASFKSEHRGMGIIYLTPSAEKKYKAIIKNHKNVLPLYALPSVNKTGYLLRVMDEVDKLRIVVYNNVPGVSPDATLHFVGHCRGITSYAASLQESKETSILVIPKASLPTGIIHFTVFNDKLTPLCERIFFINHAKDKLNMDIRSSKTTYHSREKVELELKAMNHIRGFAKGSFSVSVYDTKVKNPEQYPSSIASYLFLSADVKGNVEEPGYYFRDSLTVTRRHLDLVMMTHGWRRFNWTELLKDTLQQVSYLPEQSIAVSGKVMKYLGNKPAVGSQVKIINTKRGLLITKNVDEKGEFYINGLAYYGSIDFAIQTDNIKGKKADLRLTVNPLNPSLPLSANPSPLPSLDDDSFLQQNENRNQLERAFKLRTGGIQLDAITIRAKKETVESERNKKGMYGTPDVRIDMAKIPLGFSNILQILQGRVPGLLISGSSSFDYSAQIIGRGTPVFLLDGVVMPIGDIANVSVADVDYIDEKSGAGAGMAYGGNGGGGIIAIYTKLGKGITAPDYGVTRMKYPGYTITREFYSPKYTTSSPDIDNPDVRNTLYWNPSVKTKTTGSSVVSFFTSDVVSSYQVVVEGISDEGTPGVAYYNFDVKK